MTLLVSGDTILIRNSVGTEKFNSNNKLVYQRYSQSGSITVGAARIQVPFSYMEQNEFSVVTIKITGATGQADLVAGLLNKEIPASGGVIVDFYGRNVDSQAAADSEILGVDNIDGNLMFKTIRYTNRGIVKAGTTTINLTYYARIWSFL